MEGSIFDRHDGLVVVRVARYEHHKAGPIDARTEMTLGHFCQIASDSGIVMLPEYWMSLLVKTEVRIGEYVYRVPSPDKTDSELRGLPQWDWLEFRPGRFTCQVDSIFYDVILQPKGRWWICANMENPYNTGKAFHKGEYNMSLFDSMRLAESWHNRLYESWVQEGVTTYDDNEPADELG